MANSTALEIADAIVDTLKTINYGDSALPAVRSLFPFYELKDLATLKVTVVPKSVDIQSFGRSASEFDYEIDIAVQKAVSSPDISEVGNLADLVMTIAKAFKKKVYTTVGNAACYKQSISLYSAEHIQPPSVFTSVLTLNFKVIE